MSTSEQVNEKSWFCQAKEELESAGWSVDEVDGLKLKAGVSCLSAALGPVEADLHVSFHSTSPTGLVIRCDLCARKHRGVAGFADFRVNSINEFLREAADAAKNFAVGLEALLESVQEAFPDSRLGS